MRKYLFKYTRKRELALLLLAVMYISLTLLGLYLPYLNGNFLDILTTNPTIADLKNFIVLIIIFGLFNITLKYIFNIFQVKLQAKFSFNMISDIVTHIHKIPILISAKFNPMYISQRVNTDVTKVANFFFHNFVSFFLQGITVIVTFVIILTFNIKIFFVAIAFVPVYLLAYIFLKKPLFKFTLTYKESNANYFKTISEQFELTKEIKISASFDDNQKYIKKEFKSFIIDFMKFSRISYLFSSLDSIISLFFQICILLVGGIAIINKELTIGQYVVVNTYFTMAINCIKYYFSLGQEWQDTKVSYSRITEILEIPIERNGSMILDSIDSVKIENLSFSYLGKDELISKFSYDFKKGEIYVIVGDNGTGKTTLSNLIIGLINSTSNGSIMINGINTSEIDMYNLRYKSISTYYQGQKYAKTTVEDIINSLTGKVLNDVIDYITTSKLGALFLSENFNITEYSKKPIISLSSGELQKVGLLVSILKAGELIIFDEPTSNLDEKSAKLFIEYITTQKIVEDKITIIISHDDNLYSEIKNIIKL